MSQRNSGYARKERDLYETPEWVTHILSDHMHIADVVWEPAAGSGKMASALKDHCSRVVQSDIHPAANLNFDADFLMECTAPDGVEAIITNPPYELATQFIEHALDLMLDQPGTIAMLLRTDFDHAKSRQHLFGNCQQFAKKVVLTKRIVWFEGGKSPSFNHAWFIWQTPTRGSRPTLAYGP